MSNALFRLKSALKVTHPPSKNADFDRFPLTTSQSQKKSEKEFDYDEQEVDHGPSNMAWTRAEAQVSGTDYDKLKVISELLCVQRH